MGGALGEGWGFRPGLRGHGMDEGAIQASVSLPVVWGHQEQQLVPVERNPALQSGETCPPGHSARPPVPQRRLALRRGWVGVRVDSAPGRPAPPRTVILLALPVIALTFRAGIIS